MQTLFLKENLAYDGSQLQSHFAYRRCGLLGDSAVAFVGPCEVKLAAMVDLEDVRAEAPIFSQQMLHFIGESFILDLRGMILWQRLMVATVQEQLRSLGVTQLERRGDDLFCGEKKLSVSIATASPVSRLIHLGLNVLSSGTPVPTVGLQDLKIDAQELGELCLRYWQKEYDDVLRAACKVRGVA